MRALAYHRSDLPSWRICGPGASSMKSAGLEVAWTAKKKSGPRPVQAMPLLMSFGSKVARMASCRSGLLEVAGALSCGAVDFSAASEGMGGKSATKVRKKVRRNNLSAVLGCIEFLDEGIRGPFF